jgi:hypothetical protein
MEKNSSTQVVVLSRRQPLVARFSAVAATIACALAIAGCGLVKVGYRNGDTVGLFMINRYLDLSSEQEAFVKPRLHRLLAWHRTTQLPDYAAFGRDLQRQSMQDITLDQVEAFNEAGRRRAMTTIEHALPDMADLALQLTPDNVRALQKKFADDSDKWRAEFVKGDLEKQRNARYQRTLDRVEEWYGRLSSEQRDRVRQLSDARPMNSDIEFEDRQRRQQDLVALLTKIEHDKPAREAAVAMMRVYADHFEQNPDPDRRAFLASQRKATEEMDAKIQNMTTPAQRAKASAKLQEWIDDFTSLSADAG